MEKVAQLKAGHPTDSIIDLGAASVETKGADGKIPDGGSQGQMFIPTDLIED